MPKPFNSRGILAVLDQCCDSLTFPMLDNGYVYLAATRLSLYRSPQDWAMVVENFGYSPRGGLPDTALYTFASRLHDRDQPKDYVTREAYEMYLAKNPHNETRFVFPVQEGKWQDASTVELVAKDARVVSVRKNRVSLPSHDEYLRHGIELEEPPRVQVFELCRYLAAVHRDDVLATPEEQRISVRPEMERILQIDEWNHPDVADDERPSKSETFRQLARVLATGDVRKYRPKHAPNTHWQNWPNGGRL
ncbi:DUF7003 family protein [Limnoglobus roseus]|uniref:Uncharacterized protein n=1 Tax=Limnoglobus roseus TaxID=2598579 RepID=A0A5C1ADQ0_9BACT|nr:hypothetical protein [Limnoglobus roseus]QEL15244.1 hypothetical protein PX52LOC_02159 [Limnoglobus roseus]